MATREKLIYLVRHAEALHNIKEREAVAKAKLVYGEDEKEELERARKSVLNDEALRDAPLSNPGVDEARLKTGRLSLLNKVGNSRFPTPKLVLVSPLRRALMTATELFYDANPRPKFIAMEGLREKRTGFAADERSHVDVLQAEFPHVDFSDLRSERPEIPIGEDNLTVRARGERFIIESVQPLEEESIALVTHKGWLRELSQTLKAYVERGQLHADFDLDKWDQTLYQNAEVRVTKFVWEDNLLTSLVSRNIENALGLAVEDAVKHLLEKSMASFYSSVGMMEGAKLTLVADQ